MTLRFTPEELEYLHRQILGRLATVDGSRLARAWRESRSHPDYSLLDRQLGNHAQPVRPDRTDLTGLHR